MVFEAQALAPGLGTRSTATFRWRSIQAALSGSRVFQASTSGGGYDSYFFYLAVFCFTQGSRLITRGSLGQI